MSLERCHFCTQYVSSTKDGKAAHMRKAHGVTVRSAAPYTAEEKATIVARMEMRLGLQNFIVPEPLPKPVSFRYTCNKCGPTNNEGYWMVNGTGVCEPCVKKEAGTADQPVTEIDEDIQYHD